MKKDKSFEWNETIQKMQEEPILIGDGSNISQVKRIINEQCKCGIVGGEFELKKHIWKHHKHHCLIWKNGRIEELELQMRNFIDIVKQDGSCHKNDVINFRNKFIDLLSK